MTFSDAVFLGALRVKILKVNWTRAMPFSIVITTKDTELLVKWNSNTLGLDQHLIPFINNGWVI